MEDSSFQSPVAQFNYQSPQTQKKSRKILYIILLVIFLVVAFWISQNLFSGSERDKKAPITPTPTEYQFPTNTPVPSAGPTKEPTTAPVVKSVNPVDSATGLDRSTLSVEVQNGSGVTGAASKASDVLKSFGYKVASVGNANNEDYTNVTIQVKSTKSNFLALFKKDLGFSYTVGSASADLASSSTTDALVIIGK